MTTRIEELWKDGLQQAALTPIEPGSFRLLRVSTAARFAIYAGVDSSSNLLLAIGIRSRPPNIATESTSLDYFRQKRHDGSWLMVLRLKRSGLESVFGRLCQDLYDAADGVPDEHALVQLFCDRLALWKRLFKLGGSGFLGVNQIKGLLAEMLVLETNLRSGTRTLHESVLGWTGPLGADQDFSYSDVALEVKAVSQDSDGITISTLGQLSSLVPIQLVLVTLVPATTTDPDAVGLNSLSARLEGMVSPDPDALLCFKLRLLEAGYVENEFYDGVVFRPVIVRRYRVEEGFPLLTPDVVPKGIGSASYTIELKYIERFECHDQ